MRGSKHVLATAPLPIYVHCRAGRDRTGVVLMCLLRLLLGPKADADILTDCMTAAGASKTLGALALCGLAGSDEQRCDAHKSGWMRAYFRKHRIDVAMLQGHFCES